METAIFAGEPTQAWLNTPLSKMPALFISANEQVDFMKKLWIDALQECNAVLTFSAPKPYEEKPWVGLRAKKHEDFS